MTERDVPAIAVIGAGYWGANHARTLRDLGALVAVADRNPERAAAIAEETGTVARTPAEVLADPDIDGVVLALPPQFHAENALAAIAAGKHLLVEKPIALEIADGEAIVAAARAAGVVAMTGHVLRFHPAFEGLMDLIDSGTLGEIRYIHSHRVGLGKFHPENDALWDIAPHDLSLILAITGEEPSRVSGEGTAVIDHLSDFAHLHLTFPSGLRSHVFTSRLNPYRERRLSVIGDKAMAVFDDVVPWAEKLQLYPHRVWREDGSIHFESAEPIYQPIAEGLPLTRECAHFLHCIKTGEAPRTPVSDGLAVMRILTAGMVRHQR
ncbi:Gfo/Idh/MocA family oxidoreductase [Rhizobium sp. EC-SD404]|uniref:Gfo/Idh/MocA family protein n=1 Tax=Rhizobium sp. EC-SD404 TaxID=2038389 RepID=UPI00125A07E7|nr:Gfo/Idh/MocA family oxidoreductase [Rhizobium sp. EC-SD404]VVT10242.1 Oxidoreductase [Rhizobium sp. EC-SD404]